jgi:hypothetical protein
MNSWFTWSSKFWKFFNLSCHFWMGFKRRVSQYVGFDVQSKVQKSTIGDQLYRSWQNICIGCSIWCWFVVAFVDSMLQDIDGPYALMGHMRLVSRFTWRAQIPSVNIFFKPQKLVQKLWLHSCHENLMHFVTTNMDNCKCALS